MATNRQTGRQAARWRVQRKIPRHNFPCAREAVPLRPRFGLCRIKVFPTAATSRRCLDALSHHAVKPAATLFCAQRSSSLSAASTRRRRSVAVSTHVSEVAQSRRVASVPPLFWQPRPFCTSPTRGDSTPRRASRAAGDRTRLSACWLWLREGSRSLQAREQSGEPPPPAGAQGPAGPAWVVRLVRQHQRPTRVHEVSFKTASRCPVTASRRDGSNRTRWPALRPS